MTRQLALLFPLLAFLPTATPAGDRPWTSDDEEHTR
jgi:hypothetical protein